jgi:hypothetical protein
MRFNNLITNPKVEEACKIAEGLLHTGSKMVEEISKKNDFKYNSGMGVFIALNLIKVREPIKINSYKPFYPFTKVLGYFDGKEIYINIRKMEVLDINNLVGLLLHEYAHYCGYKHGNNFKSKDKCITSVPYFLSENIEKWL